MTASDNTAKPLKTKPKPGSLSTEVAIVGGGMTGMTLASALAGAGVDTIVIDTAPPAALLDKGYDGRASAIAFGTAQIFHGIGLWPYLGDETGPILDIRVADGTVAGGASGLFLHYDHTDIGDRPFGYMIENRVIRRALLEQAEVLPALHRLAPARVLQAQRDRAGVTVELDDGRHIAARRKSVV